MTFIAACNYMHACMELRGVSHITVGFHTKPTMIVSHHCRVHYKTGSDVHHQCRFCFKTSSDVSVPYKKGTTRYINTCMHPHFTLISQFHVLSLLTLFTLCDLVMAPRYFIAGGIIDMFSSSKFQLCIYVLIYIYLVCDILLGIFNIMQYIFLFIFLEFYQV